MSFTNSSPAEAVAQNPLPQGKWACTDKKVRRLIERWPGTLVNQSNEHLRLKAQFDFDSARSALERNKLGQFATPTRIANEIVEESLKYLTSEKIRFLDPGVGTGSFFSALLNRHGERKIETALGFDVDARLVHFANKHWGPMGLVVRENDFTRLKADAIPKVNLLIANPPYVRHHYLSSDAKNRLKVDVQTNLNIRISGLAGLYCYFLLLADRFLEEKAVSAWLIPSEFLDVNYGSAVKKYLAENVELLRVHRFDPGNTQFTDALVSSAVVWFRKRKPSDRAVLFTSGDLIKPAKSFEVAGSTLDPQKKWSSFLSEQIDPLAGAIRFSQLFKVKRGVATGANDFFILDEEKIKELEMPGIFLQSILPSPRQVKEEIVLGDRNGHPKNVGKLFLFSSDMKAEHIKAKYPKVARYLAEGEKAGISSAYLCSKRRPWYNQEKREPPLFFCTYMGRSDGAKASPFRFILNQSRAIATNVYLLLYPTPELEEMISEDPAIVSRLARFLNGISLSRLIRGGRVYGGGLHKMEPKELGNLPIQMSELGLK